MAETMLPERQVKLQICKLMNASVHLYKWLLQLVCEQSQGKWLAIHRLLKG